ncbi:V-type ATPase assembly factor PKR1 [Escovopsis weberi]|uniref:V-type ATPase assembly factor PKR1 n=1 Tax=Escovopsis weberi TaxID=150374 RepID=A0A0M9VRN6_ESCWE|nr:V-type ATPase assembly factor PKR1 [Escovopsis weberi]
MAFFVDLWESIFTPGPTPTLLRAANATFLALQLLLALLLLATSSLHFVVLSALCASLWYAVNWFAAELAAVQATATTTTTLAAADNTTTTTTTTTTKARATTDDSDTEVEGEPRLVLGSGAQAQEPRGDVRSRRRPAAERDAAAEGDAAAAERDADGPAAAAAREARSSGSTEDEWERVSESEERL